jgi:hypothetical protein
VLTVDEYGGAALFLAAATGGSASFQQQTAAHVGENRLRPGEEQNEWGEGAVGSERSKTVGGEGFLSRGTWRLLCSWIGNDPTDAEAEERSALSHGG